VSGAKIKAGDPRGDNKFIKAVTDKKCGADRAQADSKGQQSRLVVIIPRGRQRHRQVPDGVMYYLAFIHENFQVLQARLATQIDPNVWI